MWLCITIELTTALSHALSPYLPLPLIASLPIHTTPTTLLGTSLVSLGALLRLTCFRTLGPLFTFDLTILPKHTLVTAGPYAYVRHPAYTGSLAMIAGLALVNLTRGSWLAGCGCVRGGTLKLVGCVWWAWWLAVGVKRCRAEDAELRKTFGREWEAYAGRVRYWFVPGLL